VDPIQATVKAYLLETLLPGADESELTPTTPLIAGNILDSFAMVPLVTFLEQRFGIEVKAHEINADNLETIELIAALVQRKGGKG
jgi:acyl carrier protein